MDKRAIEEKVEIRKEDGKTYLFGYAIVTNRESQDLGGFTEVIKPEALRNTDFSDVIGRAEHTNSMLLGRTKSGTMKVGVDDRGAWYRIELPDTTAGKDATVYAERGDYMGSSFAFGKVKDKWEKRDNGTALRTILEMPKVYDMGPVVNPAYLDTGKVTVEAQRSLDEWKNTEDVKPADNKPSAGLPTAEWLEIERLKF